jgi:hypothetical protein
MRAIKKNAKVEFIALLFDEIERISFGTASSAHWNEDRDFLLFWQTIRSGFQSASSPFSFLIVGTNPSAVEKIKVFESDNPLFGNVEKRFIPMFTPSQVDEMVVDLGSIMGVHINDECRSRLYTDFGGHPFLTRHACSYIASATKQRPVEVDRTVYAHGVDTFKTESHSYVESVVGLLKEEYPDEHEMLKYLGMQDLESFAFLADSDPSLSEHLLGYGIVARGSRSHYFRIGITEEYFKSVNKPPHLLNQEGRLAEISARRNAMERALRVTIGQVVRVSTPAKKRAEFVLAKLSGTRRSGLVTESFERLTSAGESPLYFDELKAIVLGNWDVFAHILEMEKNEFEYHMNTVNRTRSDAHASDVNDQNFEKWRVSVEALASRLGQ